MMGDEGTRRLCYIGCLLASIALYLFFFIHPYFHTHHLNNVNSRRILSSNSSSNMNLNWSKRAAKEAEAVSAIRCSGHGLAYLDGLTDGDGQLPHCECNNCYKGHDCSEFLPDCPADVDSGDPTYLDPFWQQHAGASAVMVSGWHRTRYVYPDRSYISAELEKYIRKLHIVAKNANTEGKRLIFGVGSTHLLNAVAYALSVNSSSQAKVVATTPYYPAYRQQLELFENKYFKFAGDASSIGNSSTTYENIIEFVTSPNNPDGKLMKPVLKGPSVNTVYDHAYYWPHYTAIPAPVDEDIMLFTLSKLSGHGGTRLGWGFVKDETIYKTMTHYIDMAVMGVPKESQLKAFQIIKAILQDNGTELFNHAYKKMSGRWKGLNDIVSKSKRFSLQHIPPHFCNFYKKVRGASPAYAWLKCEREEEKDCQAVLRAAKIISRTGTLFGEEARYVRLSLIKSDDDFNMLLRRMRELVSRETTA